MKKSNSEQFSVPIDIYPAAAAAIAVNPIAAKVYLDLASEIARFMAERLERDSELQQELLSCRSPNALLEIQSKYIRDSMEHYSEEFSRYMRMFIDAEQAVIDDAKTGHSRRYNDIPL